MTFVGNSRVAETAGIGPTELDELERELESLAIGEKGINRKQVKRRTFFPFIFLCFFFVVVAFESLGNH